MNVNSFSFQSSLVCLEVFASFLLNFVDWHFEKIVPNFKLKFMSHLLRSLSKCFQGVLKLIKLDTLKNQEVSKCKPKKWNAPGVCQSWQLSAFFWSSVMLTCYKQQHRQYQSPTGLSLQPTANQMVLSVQLSVSVNLLWLSRCHLTELLAILSGIK